MFSEQRLDVLPLHVYAALRQRHATEDLFKGIQKYVMHSYRAKHAWPSKAVWEYNGTELYYYPVPFNIHIKGRIFIVPSLINGAEIFDLTEEYSFIRFLVKEGIEVYLLSWRNLNELKNFSLDDFAQNILEKSYIAACNHAQHDLHLMGHCLGGSVLLSAIPFMEDLPPPASLTLLSVPLDFHANEAPWHKYLPHLNRIKKIIEMNGNLSQSMMQSFFGQISPDAVIMKYINFLKWSEDSLKFRLFVKVEDWLNGGGDIPPKLALDIFKIFFEENNIGHFPQCPVLLLASHSDQVVPIKVAVPERVLENYSNITTFFTKNGHLGMMASSRAMDDVWQPILQHILSSQNMAAQQD